MYEPGPRHLFLVESGGKRIQACISLGKLCLSAFNLLISSRRHPEGHSEACASNAVFCRARERQAHSIPFLVEQSNGTRIQFLEFVEEHIGRHIRSYYLLIELA